ncbi:homogentisate phytyltransferase [Chamaesiphon sp.]|uniref:homogentisate phytyltransferase n=1 Tax=Chamaesiphon sp. TaxID=2814140 RepID=UPI0035943A00
MLYSDMYLSQLWKFSRPHTIIGTTLSVFALATIAIATTHHPITWLSVGQLLITWIACLLGNVYIVGLNQLYDVEIDRVNKPDLPLASGKLSIAQGQWIVGVSGVLAIAIASLAGKWLFATVALSLAIGTAYSLPPIRFKQYSLLAAICILTVRGCIVNIGLYLHFNRLFTGMDSLPPSIWVLTLFILVFTIAIALFKDVPDLEGDRQYQIETFTIVLGKLTVFNLTRWAITIAYLGTIGAGILLSSTINTWFVAISHTGLLALLWWRSRDIDLDQKGSIADFYQFIWKLFFWEYLIFPIACFRL